MIIIILPLVIMAVGAVGLLICVPEVRQTLYVLFNVLFYPFLLPKRLHDANKRIKKLEAENERLWDENERLLAENYRVGLENPPKRKQNTGDYLPAQLYESQIKVVETKNAEFKHENDNLAGRLSKALSVTPEKPVIPLTKDEELKALKAKKAGLERDIKRYEHRINTIYAPKIAEYQDKLESADDIKNEIKKAQKKYDNIVESIVSAKEILKAIKHAVEESRESDYYVDVHDATMEELDRLFPPVRQKLYSMDSEQLKKATKENRKQISQICEYYTKKSQDYESRLYYSLLSQALLAELGLLLQSLKYHKLDEATREVSKITQKYYNISRENSLSLSPDRGHYLFEMEQCMLNAISIEYAYYEKCEQIKQEQAALRAQMAQEKAERAALEVERRKIEAEEAKYVAQITEVRSHLTNDEAENAKYLKRIKELEEQLRNVLAKKDDIVQLQNGKAGFVYIISNYGSFGDNMVKIGMTRRLDPQERIDELSSASVPFRFDVHSFIFSEDAVALETELHRRLESRRVNKVNPRKEFFYANVDELEKLTHEIAPTADFHKTMLASEYHQSQKISVKQ